MESDLDNEKQPQKRQSEEESNEMFNLIINGNNYTFKKEILSSSSLLIQKQIEEKEDLDTYSIELKDADFYLDLLPFLFSEKKIPIDKGNYLFLSEVANQLQYEKLRKQTDDFKHNLTIMKESIEFRELIKYEKLIFSINDQNIDEKVVLAEKYLNGKEDDNYSNFARTLYFASICHPDLITVYFDFMAKLESIEIFIFKEYSKFPLEAFKKSKSPAIYLENCNEVSFILLKLLEYDVIQEDDVKKLNINLPTVFSHLIDKKWLHFLKENEVRVTYFNSHFDELTADDWKLHKKLALQGGDPNPIIEIIKNDDFDSFQQMETQTALDMKQKVNFTCYYNSSFMKSSSLIELAAFYSAIKIFKYLLMNDANKTMALAECAVAGGNFEIVHICEDIDCDFTSTLPVAIRFHQNDLFTYLVESKGLLEKEIINRLWETCVRYGNYPVIKKLINYGADPSSLVSEAICFRQLDLAKIILQFRGIDINVTDDETKGTPLHFSCRRKMIDVVKMILCHDDIDVNKKASYGTRPIHSACRSKSVDVVKLLLDRDDIIINDCKTEPPNKNHDLSPIQSAAKHGHVPIVKMLVAHPCCDINYRNFVINYFLILISFKKKFF